MSVYLEKFISVKAQQNTTLLDNTLIEVASSLKCVCMCEFYAFLSLLVQLDIPFSVHLVFPADKIVHKLLLI